MRKTLDFGEGERHIHDWRCFHKKDCSRLAGVVPRYIPDWQAHHKKGLEYRCDLRSQCGFCVSSKGAQVISSFIFMGLALMLAKLRGISRGLKASLA